MANAIQQSHWDAAADPWNRHFAWNAAAMQPFTDWCISAVDAAPGRRLLDVACGPGLPAIALAQCVLPGGGVVAVDIAPRMLASAERRARLAGVGNIAFGEMDAEALALADASFDGATCAFGIMFCADAVRAANEMKRAVHPGGRCAFAVWDKPSSNPFLAVFGRAVLDTLSLPTPPHDAPGPFRFAEPGALEGVLRAAGFRDQRTERIAIVLEYDGLAGYLESCRDLAAGLKPKLDAMSPEQWRSVAERVRVAAAPFLVGGRVRMPGSILCVSAEA